MLLLDTQPRWSISLPLCIGSRTTPGLLTNRPYANTPITPGATGSSTRSTILLFVQQVMHGNTAIHLRHLSSLPFTAAAYCKARQRLPRSLVERVAELVTRQLQPMGDAACRWRGHRVWHGDGTGFSMPDTPALQKRFGQPPGQKPGCGFPDDAGALRQHWRYASS